MKMIRPLPRSPLLRLVLRWLILGWWLVPILYFMRFFARLEETYWVGGDTEVKWETDPEMTMIINVIDDYLKPYFQQNVIGMARRSRA